MDEKRIQKAIDHFKFTARPSSANHSTPATVGDIYNPIKRTEELINEVVESIKT